MDREDIEGAGSAHMPPAQPRAPGSTPADEPTHVRRSRIGGILIAVVIAAVVFVLLLIFILQNTASVTIHFFGISGHLPIAVALLLAAICGLLLVAIPGSIRIVQLRRTVKQNGRTDRQSP